uniref:Riparin-5.1 n=1 Tax=Crinia riparia TaxID=446489 RepID=RIP51_CRIRI|nr:RecName: Full=Riparin-5.1 [Crinia riparia]
IVSYPDDAGEHAHKMG